jgi:hypothetical protein
LSHGTACRTLERLLGHSTPLYHHLHIPLPHDVCFAHEINTPLLLERSLTYTEVLLTMHRGAFFARRMDYVPDMAASACRPMQSAWLCGVTALCRASLPPRPFPSARSFPTSVAPGLSYPTLTSALVSSTAQPKSSNHLVPPAFSHLKCPNQHLHSLTLTEAALMLMTMAIESKHCHTMLT